MSKKLNRRQIERIVRRKLKEAASPPVNVDPPPTSGMPEPADEIDDIKGVENTNMPADVTPPPASPASPGKRDKKAYQEARKRQYLAMLEAQRRRKAGQLYLNKLVNEERARLKNQIVHAGRARAQQESFNRYIDRVAGKLLGEDKEWQDQSQPDLYNDEIVRALAAGGASALLPGLAAPAGMGAAVGDLVNTAAADATDSGAERYSVFSPETWTTHLPNALGLDERRRLHEDGDSWLDTLGRGVMTGAQQGLDALYGAADDAGLVHHGRPSTGVTARPRRGSETFAQGYSAGGQGVDQGKLGPDPSMMSLVGATARDLTDQFRSNPGGTVLATQNPPKRDVRYESMQPHGNPGIPGYDPRHGSGPYAGPGTLPGMPLPQVPRFPGDMGGPDIGGVLEDVLGSGGLPPNPVGGPRPGGINPNAGAGEDPGKRSSSPPRPALPPLDLAGVPEAFPIPRGTGAGTPPPATRLRPMPNMRYDPNAPQAAQPDMRHYPGQEGPFMTPLPGRPAGTPPGYGQSLQEGILRGNDKRRTKTTAQKRRPTKSNKEWYGDELFTKLTKKWAK